MMNQGVLQQLSGTARQAELPAPVGGLNTRDGLSAMKATDAITFTNMLSESSGVKSRNGYTEFTDEISGNVGSIIEYLEGSDNQMMVGAGTALYSVAGDGTATSLQTGLSNVLFDAAKINANMVLVNGVDGPYNYDGSTLTTPTFSGDITTPTAASMDGIKLFGSRLYMWDTDTSDFYYGATNAVSGAFSKFPLGQVSSSGGNLLAMESITRDGGDGADDYAVFILSSGEVLVYQGTDPASTFSLVGKYFIPPPIGKRCAVRLGAEVYILTQQDLIPLSEVIRTSAEGAGFLAAPSKLSGGIAEDFAIYGSNSQWQLMLYPRKGWIVINTPETENLNYHQHVLVAPTKAASRFEGWNAFTFGVFGGDLYFGGDGVIYKADDGSNDNGADIECDVQQAYSLFNSSNRKNVKSISLKYISDADVSLGVEVGYDYEYKPVTTSTSSTTIGAEWDTAEWDTAEWAGASQVRIPKYMVSGVGVSVSTSISFKINGASFTWLGTGLSYNTLKMI